MANRQMELWNEDLKAAKRRRQPLEKKPTDEPVRKTKPTTQEARLTPNDVTDNYEYWPARDAPTEEGPGWSQRTIIPDTEELR